MAGFSEQRGSFAEATSDEQMPTKLERAVEWAQRELPDQHPGLVAQAALILKAAGQPVTGERVLARLQATGRAA